MFFLSLSLAGLVSASSAAQETTKRTVEEVPALQLPATQHYGATNSLSVAAQGLNEAVRYVQADQINKWNEAIRKAALAKKKIPKLSYRSTSSPATYGTGACGGDLPPCSVMMCESGGNLTVYNHSGSGASGKWQIMPGTWNGYGGYANAADAPESVQDARAREIYRGGAGRRAWSC